MAEKKSNKVVKIVKKNTSSKKTGVKKSIKNPIKITKIKKEKKVNDDSPKSRKWSTKNIVLATILSLGIFFIAVLVIFALYIIITAPPFDKSLLYDKEMSVLKDRNGEVFARLGAENREIVYYDELPQVLIDAIVATEDSRFFQHNGFDIARFIKASFGQLAGNSGAGGASTLTMQVSKQVYTSMEAKGIEGIVRKFTDIYFAIFKLEKAYTKEEIMEFYVNTPWLGSNNAWGVEAASQTYFGKSVRDLTLAEASLLAGIFNLPASYNPFSSIELATKRRSVVLDLMVRHGYITDEQRQQAESISVESLIVKEEDRTSGLHKYQSFIDVVVQEVIDDTGNNPAVVPMEIETTLDPEIQDVLVSLNNEEIYEFINDIIQVAVAVTDVDDGSILGINGGRNQTNELAFNRATQMFRHPGSTAKPFFDYGPYLEYNSGSTYSPFFDEAMTYSDGTPIKNSDGTYLGMLTMREALKRSRNLPALQAFQAVDNDKISEFVHGLGIDYGENLYESMAIGGFDGMSPLQISAAYAAFARGGDYIEPYSYTKITYLETEDVVTKKAEPVNVMSEETAYMINSMLISTANYGVAGNLKVSGTDIAAKSGTSTYDSSALEAMGVPSSASRDNWVNVYSPDYSIAVWYGYDRLMSDYYTTALKGDSERRKITAAVGKEIFKKNSRFDVPSGVVKVKIELETFPAQLPSEYTPENMIVEEYFKRGTEPTDVSTRYSTLENPTNGTYNYSGDTVIINWDAIATPDAIDINYLQNHFNTYYSNWAEKYYNKRIDYNNKNIGTIGYNVYLQTDSGLQSLGYTQNNSYSYTCPTHDCTFVVKSAYSIFKSNMSTGLTIETSGGAGNVENPSTEEITISYNGGSKICYQVEDRIYNDRNPLYVYDSGIDVTGSTSITSDYYFNNRRTDEIDLSKEGNYLIKYYIDYDGQTFNGSKTINVCKNGCNGNNECI